MSLAYAFPEAAAGYIAREAGRCLARASVAKSPRWCANWREAAADCDRVARAILAKVSA